MDKKERKYAVIESLMYYGLLAAIITVAITTLVLVLRNRGKSTLPAEEVVVDETSPTPIMYGKYTYDEYISMLQDEIKGYKDILSEDYDRWYDLNEKYESLSDDYEKLQSKLHLYEGNVEKLYNNRYSYALVGDIDYALIIYMENITEDKALNDIDFYLTILLTDISVGNIKDVNDLYDYVDSMIDKLDQSVVKNNGIMSKVIADWNNESTYEIYVENSYYMHNGNTKTISDLTERVIERYNMLKKEGKY